MVHAIAANVPCVSLDPVNVATQIHYGTVPLDALYPVIRATGVRGPPPDLYRSCLKPACIEGTHPTGKAVRRRDLDVAPTIRSEQRSPRLEIHRRCAATIVTLKHHNLRIAPKNRYPEEP